MADHSYAGPTHSPYASGICAVCFSAQFATAVRVYVAADNLTLLALREMAKKEILRVGKWLSLPALIKVMEEAALPFKAYPGIAAYVKSRLLLFALGPPDTLSQVVLHSFLLPKASRGCQLKSPTYQSSWDNPGIELRPTKQAMERAESVSFRNAEAARYEKKNLHPQKPKAKQNGENSRWGWQRVGAFENKAEKRAEEVASEEKRNAACWGTDEWPAQQHVTEEVVDAYEHASVSSLGWGPKLKTFKRHDQSDSLTDRHEAWIGQPTPCSGQSWPEVGEAINW
ncbi:hypothetical protein FPCIR_8357 [Fusarium pseudocircinatum]|uniref:Uncharacterized protein n=1 Tax=Fusarium pseudocircinatum TaxID=56676 RepID=A0A8H5P0F8_9HYPO|nr:hypothetical protein FPCIR_8357 [Fusarium pseudocircinatum]